MSSEFGGYNTEYEARVGRAIAFAGRSHDFFVRAKARQLLELTGRHVGVPSAARVVDVGCGIGLIDRFLASRVGSLAGVDLDEEAVLEARERNPSVDYRSYPGGSLPYESGAFDVAFASCVLQLVPGAERVAFLAELRRVVTPRGLVILFEHNPLNPLTRLAVRRSDFEPRSELLGLRAASRLLRAAGVQPVESRYFLFFPWEAAAAQWVEARLRSIPFGAQYAVAGGVGSGAT